MKIALQKACLQCIVMAQIYLIYQSLVPKEGMTIQIRIRGMGNPDPRRGKSESEAGEIWIRPNLDSDQPPWRHGIREQSIEMLKGTSREGKTEGEER